MAGRQQQQIEDNPKKFSQSLKSGETLKSVSQTIAQIASEAEKSLAYLILKYRLPELKKYLFMKPNPQVGKLLENTDKTDFENQYTEGAQRTTYEILMRPSGVGADLNNDGLILDRQEANQLPCNVLIEIERLWREATEKRCGWYGIQDIFSSPDCRELDINANTLTMAIFDSYSVPFVEKRLNYCGIVSPQPANLGG